MGGFNIKAKWLFSQLCKKTNILWNGRLELFYKRRSCVCVVCAQEEYKILVSFFCVFFFFVLFVKFTNAKCLSEFRIY